MSRTSRGFDARRTDAWRRLMHLLRGAGPYLRPSLFSHLWFNGPFEARVFGVSFKMHHVGAFLENEVFWRGAYLRERTFTRLLADRISDAELFFDIGANSGYYSLFVKSVNPRLRVFAFEPSVVNFDVLRKNVELNGFDIETLPAAVTDKDAEVVFFDTEGFSYSASLVEDFRPNMTGRPVAGVTLDGFTEQHGLSGKRAIFKIDVEGHEEAVVRGATRLFAERAIAFVELLTPEAVSAVASILQPGPYRFSCIDEDSGTARDVTSEVSSGTNRLTGNFLLEPNFD